MKINVILTGYNRPNNLQAQHHAILNQSIYPNKVEIWYNKGTKDMVSVPGLYGVYCNKNYKYWGRFALGLLQDCDFIAIFDDDTIPGRDWFKTCLDSFEKKPGIYGAVGVKLLGDFYHKVDLDEGSGEIGHIKTGWTDNVSEITEVDLVGHSWFFPREYLLDFWKEKPYTWQTGEDMHFSYCCQKYSGIKTYVPPQNIRSTNGSLNPHLGSDQHASWIKKDHWKIRNECVKHYIDNGWRLVKDA